MSKTLLVYVEDDEMSRDVMALLVETSLEDFDLITFEDSHNFMSRMQALPKQPDLIMLDIHVPPLDGFQMLRELRQSDQFAASKVIALTASVMNDEVRRLRDAGFNGAISKPINQTQFMQNIERILNGEQIWLI